MSYGNGPRALARMPARAPMECYRQLTADAAMAPALALSTSLNSPILSSTFATLR
jgi:hypothetical protein